MDSYSPNITLMKVSALNWLSLFRDNRRNLEQFSFKVATKMLTTFFKVATKMLTTYLGWYQRL